MRRVLFQRYTLNNEGVQFSIMDSNFYTASSCLGRLYSVDPSNIGQRTMDYCVGHNTSLQEERKVQATKTDGAVAGPLTGNVLCQGTIQQADPGWSFGGPKL